MIIRHLLLYTVIGKYIYHDDSLESAFKSVARLTQDETILSNKNTMPRPVYKHRQFLATDEEIERLEKHTGESDIKDMVRKLMADAKVI